MRTSDRRMTEAQRVKIVKRKRIERVLRIMIVMLLCAGIAVQAVLIIRLARKNRETAGLQAEINRLNSDAVNYQLTINSNQNREALRTQAENKLGMVEPTDEQIRVVHVNTVTDSDTQLAMNNIDE